MKLTLSLLLFLAVTQTTYAKCFRFDEAQASQVGPIRLWSPASRVCVNKVHGLTHNHYAVRFSNAESELAQFVSQKELLGRCPGFCRAYVLTSGNSNGVTVNPDKTSVQFQAESGTPLQGKLRLVHPSTGELSFSIVEEVEN